MFSSVVLSFVLQQETATEILRSQGKIGFQKEEEEGKLQQLRPLAHSYEQQESLDLFSSLDVLFLSCQRPQWNRPNQDTSLSEVPMYTHTGRRLVQYSLPTLHLLLFSLFPHSQWFHSTLGFLPLTTSTLLIFYGPYYAGPGLVLRLACKETKADPVPKHLANVMLVAATNIVVQE